MAEADDGSSNPIFIIAGLAEKADTGNPIFKQVKMMNTNQQEDPAINQTDIINIFFRKCTMIDYPPLAHIKCNRDDKVADAIEKYREISNDYDLSKKFIFNAKKLDMEEKLSEAKVTNKANIFVVNATHYDD